MTCPKCNGRTCAPVSRITDRGQRYMRIRRCTAKACGWSFATSEVAANRANAKRSLKSCSCGGRMVVARTETLEDGARTLRLRVCERKCGQDFATFEEREAPPEELEDDPAQAAAPRRALVARAR